MVSCVGETQKARCHASLRIEQLGGRYGAVIYTREATGGLVDRVEPQQVGHVELGPRTWRPHPGAGAVLVGRRVTTHDAEFEPDLDFPTRQTGKIWKLTPTGPIVVCSVGMPRPTEIGNADGSTCIPSKLRRRFGKPSPLSR